ncbi:MAG: DUF86 domain-containing protein [Bradymonadales bacterium]|nr:DUF86 domain-containing protein [Bradymonadales bacterium]
MPRDHRLVLDDILDAIDRIREYTLSLDLESFERDRKTQDAVVRNLEIIGEAAGHLPESIKEMTRPVEWRKIIGLRNILVHQYFGVSLPVVWDVLQNKLHTLETVCRKLLEEHPADRDEAE